MSGDETSSEDERATEQATRQERVSRPPSAKNPKLHFRTGQLIGGRYRIQRFLAQGGMGEVYEAVDEELEGRVALKVVRKDRGDARAMESLKREVHLARQVTHPNVCRIYELGHHDSQEEQLTFLTMEMLAGNTLGRQIAEAKRLSTGEALPIVVQLAAGLAAAHEAGVVHRDLKPANIFLVPPRGSTGSTRVVITDFGIARGTDEQDPRITVSVAGSPAYMAPEQLENENITSAADIYALGVVMFEMVTGELPFSDAGTLSSGRARLRKAAPAARTHVPDLDPNWEVVIARCLERVPAARFASVADVAHALTSGKVPVASRRARARVVIGALVVLAAFALRAFVFGSNDSVPADQRPAVAVLGFRNLAARSDVDWLSTALSEMFDMELSSGERIRTIPADEVARTKRDLALTDADHHGREALARVRSLTGADYVIVGSFLAPRGGKITLYVRLQDVRTGETVAAVTEETDETGLAIAVSRVSPRLRERLGVTTPPADEARLALPAGTEAARYYSEGLAKLRVNELVAARDQLEKAVAADPRHPLARSALGVALAQLGYDDRASEQAERAFELSSGLPREDRLLIEARYRESRNEWDAAIEIHRRLGSMFPDDIEHGLRLAGSQLAATKAKDAIETVSKLARLNKDPRIDMLESEAARELGDYVRAKEAGRRATEGARSRGSLVMSARAAICEGSAELYLGDFASAKQSFSGARRMYSEAGDRVGAATAIRNEAIVSRREGQRDTAILKHEEALAIFRDLGHRASIANQLSNIGYILSDRDPPRARSLFAEALVIFEEMGEKNGAATTHRNLSEMFLVAGDLEQAERHTAATLALGSETQDRHILVWAHDLGTTLHRMRGDVAAAAVAADQARRVAEESGSRYLQGIGIYATARASWGVDSTQTRDRLRDAIALVKALGAHDASAELGLVLARAVLDDGDSAEAEVLAREVLPRFQAGGRPPYEVEARSVLALAALDQGRIADARSELDAIAKLPELYRTHFIDSRVVHALARARLARAEGRIAEALADLETELAYMTKLGPVPQRHELALALGKMELESSRVAAGRRRLATLAKESRQLGVLTTAARAEAARRARPR